MVLILIIQVLNQKCSWPSLISCLHQGSRKNKSNIKLFADDTTLVSIVKNPGISANDLNYDLDVIPQWKLEFNPDPTKQIIEVLFSCQKSSPNHPQIMCLRCSG